MRTRYIIGAAVSLFGVPQAVAQDAGEADRLRDIQQQLDQTIAALHQRDQVIDSLSRRIRTLEMRVSAQPLTAPPARPAGAAPPTVAQPSPPQAATPTAPARPPAARAPSAPGQEPIDLLAAQRALEQTLVATGVTLLSPGAVQIEPAFTYFRNEQSFPSFLTSGGTLATTTVANSQLRQNIYQGDVAIRVGLPYRSQIELDVPYRFVDQRTNISVGLAGALTDNQASGSDFSDVSVALSKTLADEGVWRPGVIATVAYSADTGGTVAGFNLGNGYPILRGQLTAEKSVDPVTLVAALGYGKGFATRGFSPGNEFDVNVGAYLSASPETTLRFLLNQRFLDTGRLNGRRAVGTGITQSTLVIGASVIVAPHTLLDFSLGVGLTSDTPKYFVRVGLPISFSLL